MLDNTKTKAFFPNDYAGMLVVNDCVWRVKINLFVVKWICNALNEHPKGGKSGKL